MGPRLEDFEIVATIGSGSHGTVRKVRRRQDGQILVWKELNYGAMSETEKQGLVLEVNLLRELKHPNIVKFLHHVVDKRSTTLYILMEHCPGGDLKRLISKCRQTSTFLEEGFIWRVLKQVCDALKICHTRQLQKGRVILHRDIKPANVFLDANGDVKLGDFGLARTLNSEASFATTFVGTPYYMSPEVVNGQEYNEMSDMWSLGCLIYELCALHPPFQATTHKQLAAKIREGRYDRIPIHYSSDLQEILGLLLTYEDFLRPSALMVLRHSVVRSHTSQNYDKFEDDPLCHSLRPSVLLGAENARKTEENATREGSSGTREKRSEGLHLQAEEPCISKESGSHNFKGLREKSGQRSERPGGTPLAETFNVPSPVNVRGSECDTRASSSLRTTQETQLVNSVSESGGCVPSHVKPSHQVSQSQPDELCESIERICQAAKEMGNRPPPSGESISDADLARPECACGGMSPRTWRERVQALRESEAAVREREISVKEREREVSHREHRVAAMEREARQHLVRAQIYLRQTRTRQNAATSPHRPPSDLDTTMSADPGDVAVATTTKLDPQRIENPFLKMRGGQQPTEKRVSFKDKSPKVKSNTLDNPKSRRKRGNIFGLVDRVTAADKSNEVPGPSRQPLKAMASAENMSPNAEEELAHPSTQATTKGATGSFIPIKGPYGLRERPRSTENLHKNVTDATGDKENKVSKKKAPEVKPGLWNWRTRNKNVAPRREQSATQKRVLQFYNIV